MAKFMQSPKQDHWAAALIIVRYLKNCLGQGILMKSNSYLKFRGWCDSDWVSCLLTRKSITGYFVQFGDSSIAWKIKKQKTVSRSSAEAEYRAMAYLTSQLIWLKRVLQTLGVSHPGINGPLL